MPTIQIDNEVLEKLKESAEPFVDTPNTVLRRILGLPPRSEEDVIDDDRDATSPRVHRSRKPRASRRAKRGPRTRAKAGTTLPEEEYELPILEIIAESGGRAPTREVIDALGDRLNGRLTDTDHDRLSSGEIRWRNRAQFVRLNLIERGDMAQGSPRGVWEISEQGRSRLGDGAKKP